MPIWPITQGDTLKRWVTIADANGAPIAYDGSQALTCEIWLGDQQPALLTITPTWFAPATGQVQIFLTAVQTAAFPLGTLKGIIRVTDSDGPKDAAYFGLEVSPQPGTDAALSFDITFGDLQLYAPHIRTLYAQNTDLAGFLMERHRAQTWYREAVRDNYRPQPGRARRYVDATGAVAGPFLRFSDGPGGAQQPGVATLYGYLTGGGLQLTDRIKECQAQYAASIVLLALPGKGNDYNEQGNAYLARAMMLFPQCVNDVDPLGGANPTLRVDRDITWTT